MKFHRLFSASVLAIAFSSAAAAETKPFLTCEEDRTFSGGPRTKIEFQMEEMDFWEKGTEQPAIRTTAYIETESVRNGIAIPTARTIKNLTCVQPQFSLSKDFSRLSFVSMNCDQSAYNADGKLTTILIEPDPTQSGDYRIREEVLIGKPFANLVEGFQSVDDRPLSGADFQCRAAALQQPR